MSDPFMGELRLFSFNYAPRGWAQASGQLLPINQNQALFSLFGTTYGGNGQTNFALPDLRGRAPRHVGAYPQGASFGTESHTLTVAQLPAHSHAAQASRSAGDRAAPFAQSTASILAAANNVYGPPTSLTTLSPSTIASVGGSQAHENRSPLLALNWCVALVGIFPSRT